MKSGNIVSFDAMDTGVSGIIAPTEAKTTGTPGALAFAIMVAAATVQAIWIRKTNVTGGKRYSVFIRDSAATEWSSIKSTLAMLLPGNTGFQVYQRVGEDGRIVEFKALGRDYPEPSGGVSGLNSAVDLLPTRRMNVGALIDKLLDLDACKGVWLDQNETANPDGNVYAFDETRAANVHGGVGAVEPSVVIDVTEAAAPDTAGNPGAFV